MPDDLEALAVRAERRALDMVTDTELLEIELAALNAQKDARWQAYDSDKSDATRRQWIVFHDRLGAVRRSAETTREDAEHYAACAAALRAQQERPTP